MNIKCTICDRQIETKNEDIYVTANWICDDLVKKNNYQLNKSLPRLVKICKKCWDNTFKNKPQSKDYYWMFDRTL